MVDFVDMCVKEPYNNSEEYRSRKRRTHSMSLAIERVNSNAKNRKT